MPLRPDAAVAQAVDAQLGPAGGPTLLLGVTPELAKLPREIVAVDWNADMVRIAWLGNTGHRRVALGDWRAMPVADGSMAAAMGDGSLMMLAFTRECRGVLELLRLILAPGGRIAFRCFTAPDDPGTPASVVGEAREGRFGGFHAFKLAFNMAVAGELDDVTVTSALLHDRFSEMVTDRADFCRATGWDEATVREIDAYRDSHYIHSYPPRGRVLDNARAVFPDAHFVETAGYPLAERCPILVATRQ